VAAGVVDPLEVVAVQVENAVIPARHCAGVFHALAEEVAVGQSRQRVVEVLMGQLLLELVPLADVCDVEHDAVDRRIIEAVGQLRPDMAPFSVPATQPRLHFRHGARPAGHDSIPGLRRALAIIRMQQLGELDIACLVINELLAEGRRDEHDAPLPVDHQDAVAGVLDQRRQPAFPAAHGLPAFPELAQQPERAHKADADGDGNGDARRGLGRDELLLPGLDLRDIESVE
jgi:hypothetical protein